MKRVTIIGAGVAGLTAAQELLDRGFAVDLYELNSIPGGKARSIEVPVAEYPVANGLRKLPAEHGFRFFPGFYRHINDTMARIPFPGASSVAENLVDVKSLNYARFKKNIVSIPVGAPTKFSDVFGLLKKWTGREGIDMPIGDLIKYWGRLLRFFSSCTDRVNEEYEQIAWWDFLQAKNTSEQYRRYFGNGTRILVAADPKQASTRTNGMITEQLLIDQTQGVADRVLSGPTNLTWLFPWASALVKNPNCRIFLNAKVNEITADTVSGTVTGFTVTHRDPAQGRLSRMSACDISHGPTLEPIDLPVGPIVADYYIAAVPVEVMAGFLHKNSNSSDLAAIAPELQSLDELKTHTEWMNGIVFYLKGQFTSVSGHSVYTDTPFALSSIFQDSHWSLQYAPSKFGQGNLTGICSVIASNWLDTEPSDERIPNGGFGYKYGLSASDTIFDSGNFANGKGRLIDELWSDLKLSLTVDGVPLLHNSNFEYAYIDPAISIENGRLVNSEPLLVNRVDGWRLRPTAITSVPNFFLAGDYIKTNTDLATMESACEAAKQAVNGILDASKSSTAPCTIYPLKRLPLFAPMRYLDKLLYHGWSAKKEMP